MDLCEVVERKRGAQAGMQWRKQTRLDLVVARETEASAEEADKDGMEK